MHARANAFTTGSGAGGYTLNSITLAFTKTYGSPGNLVVALHASSGGNPAATASATLTGDNPGIPGGVETYTCSGSGCNLSPNTTYFVVLSAPNASSDGNFYAWRTTVSDSQFVSPAGAGWAIADALTSKVDSGNWTVDAKGLAGKFKVSTTASSLTASSISKTGATLTLAGHTGAWYYKRTGGPSDSTCHTVDSGTTATLGSLTANTSYTYTVYSATNCATALDSVTFNTQLTVSNLSQSKDDYHEVGVVANQFRTGSNGGGYTLSSVTVSIRLKHNSPGRLQMQLWTDNGANEPGSQVSGATLSGSDPPSNGGEATYTCSGACSLSANTPYWLRLSASSDQGRWWWNDTDSGNETLDPAGTGWSIGDNKLPHLGWTDLGGTSQSMQVTATAKPTLAASSVTKTTATLTLSHYSGPWWLKRTDPADTTCKSKGTTATESLATLTIGASYTYKAYGKDGCNSADEIATLTFSTLNYTLTASDVTTTGATLTIGRGYNAQWWYKRTNPTGDNTCHSVVAGTTTASLSGLDGGTSYTYKAYSKDGCNSADEIVTLTFSTLNYTLTVSGITATRALLTIGRYKTNAQWWYKRTIPTGDNTCHSVAAGTTTASLSGLDAYESHTYKAYDKANCNSADEIQTVTFSTPVSLTVSGIGTAGATLTIAGRTPPNPSWSWTWWYYKRTGGPADTTCTTVSSDNTATLGSLTANTSYTYTVYSGTNCWRALNSVTFSTQLTVSNLSETTAASNGVGGYVRRANQFRTGGNGGGYTLSAVTVDMGQKTNNPNPLQVQLWSDSSGAPGSQVSGATLSGSDPPSGGGETTYTCSGACSLSTNTSYWVRLSTSGFRQGSSWNWNNTNSGDETLDPTGTGWSIGDNKRQDSGNPWTNVTGFNQLKVSAIAKPALAASSVTTTTATLTLSHYSGTWWLKRTTPADTTCKSKGTTATESLTTLTAGTSYTYKAYSKNGCHSANEIATVTFSTTGSGQGSTTVVAGWRLERDGAGVLRVTAKPNAAPAASASTVSTPTPGSRDDANDVGTLAAAGNTSPDGLWSDGATLWVVDTDDRMLYAYDLASKARDPGRDVALSRNTRPLGLASDGITLWVSDYQDGQVYAYAVPGTASATGADVTLHPDNASPSALWTDGATLWVAEDSDGRLYAYDLSDGLRDPGKDLTLHADNASSGGLWSDGVTMWVSDPEDGRVYAYRLSDGRRDASLDYTVSSDSARVYGLWSDGWTLWVVDDGGDRVLAHHAW